MKKRNHKILLALIALSANISFTATPLITTAYATTITQTQNQTFDIKADGKNTGNLANNTFTLTNKGDTVNLSKVKLRYYFTSDENTNSQNFSCYYSAVSGLNGNSKNITNYVHGTFVKLDKPVKNADSYLEISFDEEAGTFDSSETLILNTAINNDNWSKMNSDDDYSFNDSSKTIILVNDEVTYGTAPIPNEETTPKISFGGETVKGGESVNIPINISNVKKMGISKFHMKVSYDPNIFEFGGCITNSPSINKLGYDVKTGNWHNRDEHTIDIGYDFTKSETTKALYEEGDYVTLPLKALNNVDDGVSYLKVVVEPTLTDASGKEYSGDNITIDSKPITLKYNKDAVKNSSISQNYLTFDEDTVKDTDITMKKYENTVTSIQCNSASFDEFKLNAETDFSISDNILTLKESFLKTLLGKNAYLTIKFDKGYSVPVFINNDKFNSVSDSLRSNVNDDEQNIAFAKVIPSNIDEGSPITFAVTNTGKVDMDLEKLDIKYYYEKDAARISDSFSRYYCSIIGSNKDMRPYSRVECNPYMCEQLATSPKGYMKESFDKGAGVLKPGETLVVIGCFEPDHNISRTFIEEPVVTYDNESLYGQAPDYDTEDSKINSDDIILNSTDRKDTPVELELNRNALTSIDEYSEGNLVKTLEKGTDYVLTKRNEVVLTKSYLDSVDKNLTLDFKFSGGHDDTIDIKAVKHNDTIPNGALTISNKASTVYGCSYVGGVNNITWDEKLTVPIVLKDSVDGKINNSCVILKFNKYLFDDVTIEHLITPDAVGLNAISSAEVNYELGIIKIKLNHYIYKTSDAQDFNLIFTPKVNTKPQKVDLTLDSDSYYETESGDIYRPIFNYNDIELALPDWNY